LLDAGADVEAKDRNDNTVIYWACYRGHVGIVRLLLSHGADANVRDSRDRTPLDRVIELHSGDTRERLLDLFREFRPDLVMEAYCTKGPEPGN